MGLKRRTAARRRRPVSGWNDTFLDRLRRHGDASAEQAIAKMFRDGEIDRVKEIFSKLDSNDTLPPGEIFPVLRGFLSRTGKLPRGVQLDRIRRGEKVFADHAFEGALVLLVKSLPEGYQSPPLAIMLNASGHLRRYPWKRLLATLQLVLNVSATGAFEKDGHGIASAQKLRLLHAAIRRLMNHFNPTFAGRHGVPANQEDMLATVLGFSLLVIQGWRTLGVGLSRDQEEDFLYIWLVYAHMMGIHPVGKPHDMSHLPADVADAEAMYNAYRRRHYVSGDRNPDGVALARSDLRMLRNLIPWPLRLLGFGVIPRMYMNDLIGREGCANLGIRPVRGHAFFRFLMEQAHRVWNVLDRSRSHHHRLSRLFFRDLIVAAYGGRVTFTLPASMEAWKGMIDDRYPRGRHHHTPARRTA